MNSLRTVALLIFLTFEVEGWCFWTLLGYSECPDDSKCIRHDQFCDGTKDCDDGSDESVDVCKDKDCHYNQDRCPGDDPKCIYKTQFCDGTEDCAEVRSCFCYILGNVIILVSAGS